MAKLKCDAHKRRVFAINGKFIHRGGWGDMCASPTATICGETYTAKSIDQKGMKIASEEGSNLTGAKKLLKEIFGG